MRINYQNSSRLLCVIGDPIGHSLSPLLQNTMLEHLGEDAIYLAVPVKAGEIASFVSAAKTLGILGFNLTMPHKEGIIPLLSSMTPEAMACKSVNSVRIKDGKLEGHSTDGIGFRRSIQDLGWDYPGNTVTILGAGGAAKSIALTAAHSGVKHIHVVNRTLPRAEQLCQGQENMTPHSLELLPELLPQTDILINTTPVGMQGAAGGAIPDLSRLKQNALCMDCIYAPALTPFMQEAQSKGHLAANGIGMLVYQAIYALEFFLDRSFSPETIQTLGKKLLDISGVDPLGKKF